MNYMTTIKVKDTTTIVQLIINFMAPLLLLLMVQDNYNLAIDQIHEHPNNNSI